MKDSKTIKAGTVVLTPEKEKATVVHLREFSRVSSDGKTSMPPRVEALIEYENGKKTLIPVTLLEIYEVVEDAKGVINFIKKIWRKFFKKK